MATTCESISGETVTNYTAAETAQFVRAALKAAFPGQTFSVRSRSYSGGASVDVNWTDGPTSKEVERVAKRYEGADFYGMIDLKTYKDSRLDGQRVHFGADWVQCQRTVSADLLRECAEKIADKYGVPAPEVKVEHWTHKGKVRESAWIDRDGEPLDRYADGRVANYASTAGDKALQLAYATSTYRKPSAA